jgi:hypothetical protein
MLLILMLLRPMAARLRVIPRPKEQAVSESLTTRPPLIMHKTPGRPGSGADGLAPPTDPQQTGHRLFGVRILGPATGPLLPCMRCGHLVRAHDAWGWCLAEACTSPYCSATGRPEIRRRAQALAL